MTRSVKEWIGRGADSQVPPRVRLRVFEKFGRACNGCGRELRPGDRWICDHEVALINGGENREANLRPLCAWCNPGKTAADVAEKSITQRKRLKHAGIKLRTKSPPMIGTIASGWKHRLDGSRFGVWERR